MAGKIPRRVSRSLAFQVLYGQEFVSCADRRALERAFNAVPTQHRDNVEGDDPALSEEPSGFAWELVLGVWENLTRLDEVIAAHAKNWRLERVGRVELTLLRLAAYEMLCRKDVPAKVAMNEALELNRMFGEAKSKSFINGILDAIGKDMDAGTLSL